MTVSAGIPAPPTGLVHVARQPIMDGTGLLYGYELLFRGAANATTAEAPWTGAEADAATTATILSAFSEFGSQLLGGRLGFVNMTRAFLVGELPVPFPPNTGVLEVLETIEIDDEVVAGAAARVAEGHRLALDDFVWSEASIPLLKLADIVKIDVLGLTWDEVVELADRCRPYDVRLLAERVEDDETLDRCLSVGFELFQGYYFGRPQTMTMERLGPGQTVALQLLTRLADPEATAGDVEEILRTDPALSVRLLRIANSAHSGLARRMSSIRDAVVLVGLARLRAWMVLIATEGNSGQRQQITDALVRARTCELSAAGTGVRPDAAFTLGLLHGVAEVLCVPMKDFVAGLPALTDDLKAALAGEPSPLHRVLDDVLQYEKGDLGTLSHDAAGMLRLASAYLEALAWTTDTLNWAGG